MTNSTNPNIALNWNALIKPKKIDFKDQKDATKLAVLVAEPLERGFGTTIGNALRRVLLSSLQGAAITAIKIAGVDHEFSTIPGVREDVTEIILNIKTIALRSFTTSKKKLTLKATGPCTVDRKSVV